MDNIIVGEDKNYITLIDFEKSKYSYKYMDFVKLIIWVFLERKKLFKYFIEGYEKTSNLEYDFTFRIDMCLGMGIMHLALQFKKKFPQDNFYEMYIEYLLNWAEDDNFFKEILCVL